LAQHLGKENIPYSGEFRVFARRGSSDGTEGFTTGERINPDAEPFWGGFHRSNAVSGLIPELNFSSKNWHREVQGEAVPGVGEPRKEAFVLVL